MTQTPKTTRKSSTVVAKSPKKRTKKLELPPNPFVHEILDYVTKQRSKVAKIEALKQHRNPGLVSILIWNFDETVQSMMPEGNVPYTPNDVPEGTDHTSLRKEQKYLYNFVKGGNDTLNGIRRETMFIQMLEGLHPGEANIIILVKDKRLSDKYAVTYEMVKEAYPDITWGGRS